MDHRIAEFVRWVADGEVLKELVSQAKADTWTYEREHAVLVVKSGSEQRFVMVRGGRDEILLERQSDGTLFITAEGVHFAVSRLAWHVHPRATGPSDHDRRALDELGQERSMLYEIGGPSEGTPFTRMSVRKA